MRRHGLHTQQVLKPGSIPDPASLLRAYDSDYNPSRPVRPSPLNSSTIQGLPLELIDRLRSFPLFASAPDTFLGAIGKYLRPQLHQPHEYILTEGDDARSMYWVVRGAVSVTSRDGESTYAELKPGSFFGEIGILMDIPRTATIVAKLRSLVVKLNKEDLQKELPNYPEVERAIRDEANERLAILKRMKKENTVRPSSSHSPGVGVRKRSRDFISEDDVEMTEAGEVVAADGENGSNKRRKSPSPTLAETAAASVIGSTANLTVRQILQHLPLFSCLPDEILHFLGINVQPCTFPPFTDIIKQGSYGRDVYFLVKGEVEVVTETPSNKPGSVSASSPNVTSRVKARLKPGQYFGEVASLLLAPKRTATVRTINGVELLRVSGEILDELWRTWSTELKQQVEEEAKRRLREVEDTDIVFTDAFAGTIIEPFTSISQATGEWKSCLPKVTFTEEAADQAAQVSPVSAEPIDPDPFFNASLDSIRAKSRRGSLAPPPPPGEQSLSVEPNHRQSSPPTTREFTPSPLRPAGSSLPPSPQTRPIARRPSVLSRDVSLQGRGRLSDNILILIFQHLELHELMRLRRVSGHWHELLTSNKDLIHTLDLSMYNRKATDEALMEYICPFVGNRPQHVNMNNCFHLSDVGFNALVDTCGTSIRTWKMRSVWDVTGQAILELINKAKSLEDIDLSNCRKVGDNLLARIVGWVVPHPPPGRPAPSVPPAHSKRAQMRRGISNTTAAVSIEQPVPGTVIGAPCLKRLTLSYCKHVQDRSMAHIAAHASNRLESIDLTRCTSVTDQGFQHWSIHDFPRLRKLVLADCTYLSDQAIVGIANAARGLRELDLSFCCALSDTATEVLSLGLTHLTHLDLAFCGSAVSDSSLRSIGLHLLELKYLSVRGCVRVTGQGVEAVIDGCRDLELFDVSQCKNLAPWLCAGGVKAARLRGCNVNFQVVADGKWRSGLHI